MKKIATLIMVFLVAVSAYSVLSVRAESIERLTNNTEDDFGPSMCVDSLGRPHIAWVKGVPSAYDIYYGVKTGSSWSISKVTSLSSRGMFFICLCLDGNGRPRIAALTETNRWDLWYVSWDETTSNWTVESVANGGTQSHCNYVSLTVDSGGSPHIVWAARWGTSGLFGIFYATKSGTTWSIETVSHDDETAPSIALDSAGQPHVLWNHIHYAVNPRLQYASRVGGTWIIEDIPGGEHGDTNNPRQLFIDSSNVPHIVFNKVPSPAHSELWYGNKTHGSWSLTRIRDSTFDNFHPSLSLSSSDVPCIAFQSNEAGNYDVYLATITGESWDVAQFTHDSMDEGNNPGPSVYVDSADNTHLAWYAPQIGSGQAEIYYQCAYAMQPPMSAYVDIDPNTLNLMSSGRWITAYIELPEGYDAADIDVSTLMLNGSVPAEASPTSVGDHDKDGVPDLMVKLSRAEVEGYIISVLGIITEPTWVTLTITGSLTDETAFEGSDTIRVICRGGGGPGKMALLV